MLICHEHIPFIAVIEKWINEQGGGMFYAELIKPKIISFDDPMKCYELSFLADSEVDPIRLEVIFSSHELMEMWLEQAGFKIKKAFEDSDGIIFYASKMNDIERARMKRKRGF